MHFTNYFSCHKTISCLSDSKRYLFTLYHIISLPFYVLSWLCFTSWSSPLPLLFNWLRVQLSRSSQSYIPFEMIHYPTLSIFSIYWIFIYVLVLAKGESALSSKCARPFLLCLGGREVEPSTKISKRGAWQELSFQRGGCWKRQQLPFSGEIANFR